MRTGSEDRTGMLSISSIRRVAVPGPGRSEHVGSEDVAAPARQMPSEPPPAYPGRDRQTPSAASKVARQD